MATLDEPTVTISQIAELTDYGVSAVSNWRRRYEDFPQPVQTAAGGRDLFLLSEVEDWLKQHQRFRPDGRNEVLIFEAANILRGRTPADEGMEAIAAAIALSEITERLQLPPQDTVAARLNALPVELGQMFGLLEELDPVAADQVVQLTDQIEEASRADVFEAVLSRRARFVETRTGGELISLLVRLASPAQTIFDSTAGEGTVLTALAREARADLELFGQEINEGAWWIANQRLLMHLITVDLEFGDSLLDDAFTHLGADMVICDPPFGMPNPLLTAGQRPPAWASFAAARARSADFAWLEHAVAHLNEHGRAYVLLPVGSLFRRGVEREMRMELLRRGSVEAVVALPPGSAPQTKVSLALWVMRQSEMTREAPVLLVDASRPGEQQRGLDREGIERIVSTVVAWRDLGKLNDAEPGFAVPVSVAQLLANDADLSPSRWVQVSTSAPAEDRVRSAEAAIARFAVARDRVAREDLRVPALDDAVSAEWVSVRDLAATDVAEVVRGVRFRQEECIPHGIRVLRTHDIRDTIANDDPCFADIDEMRPRPVLTEPGDIILSPASGKLRTVVDEEGGHILASPLQALRFRADWVDPHVAAAFLASPRNRRFAKSSNSAYTRVDLRDLELPVLPLEQAQRLRAALDDLATTERDARALADQAQAVREAILEVVGDAGDQPWK